MTLLLVFPVHFCQILIVVLFYVAGFPRKQTGKNLYFLIFCSCVGNPVATHTHTHTYTPVLQMRQVLLGLVCCNTEVFRVWTKHTLSTPPSHSCTHTHTHTVSGTKGSLFWGRPITAFHCEQNSGLSQLGPVYAEGAIHSLPRFKLESGLVAPPLRSVLSLALLPGCSAERLHILSGCHIIQ